MRIVVGVALVGGGVGLGRALPRQAAAPAVPEPREEIAHPQSGAMATALLAARLARMEQRINQLGPGREASRGDADAEMAVLAAAVPVPLPPTPPQIRAKEQLTSIISASVQKRFWSDADRKAALELRLQLSEADLAALTDQVILAVNRQELKTESPGFPLSPALPVR